MTIGIIAFTLSVIIALLLKKLQIPSENSNYNTVKKHKDSNDLENEIVDKMYNRIGSSQSLIRYDDMNNTKHKYSQVDRFDILDYNINKNSIY